MPTPEARSWGMNFAAQASPVTAIKTLRAVRKSTHTSSIQRACGVVICWLSSPKIAWSFIYVPSQITRPEIQTSKTWRHSRWSVDLKKSRCLKAKPAEVGSARLHLDRRGLNMSTPCMSLAAVCRFAYVSHPG